MLGVGGSSHLVTSDLLSNPCDCHPSPPRMRGPSSSGLLLAAMASALCSFARSGAIVGAFRPTGYRHAIHFNGSHSTRDFCEALNDSRVDFIGIELHRLQSDQMLGFTKTSTRSKLASPAMNNTSLRGLDISCNRFDSSLRLRLF